MADNPTIDVVALNVTHITVSADGTAEASLGFALDGDKTIQLRMAPTVLAKLEAMLAKASTEQAKHQPLQ